LYVLLAGCGFEHGAAARLPDGDVHDDPIVDAAIDAPVVPFCDPDDTSLVACYEFEGNANDASSNMLDAITANVGYATGRRGMALLFDATSSAEVPDSAALDVAALTIEAWIHPSQAPGTGLRMGIIDMEGRAGFFLQDSGQIRCIASTSAQVAANIALDTWTHVACTYDPPTLTIYVNGVAFPSVMNGGPLATTSTTGISIAADNPAGSGSRLIGMIDELRLMSRARTANEICVDAGTCDPP
jgi:hypothetical protein